MMKKEEKIMVTEHILEMRHGAVGSFLDVRGFVADYVRNSGFLPHWSIDANIVNFRDESNRVEKEGAFAGYKSFGYFTYNPPTKNFFQDRAISFVKLIDKNSDYNIPNIARFGCRSKIFIPYEKDFDLLNGLLNENFISDSLRDIVSHKETDLQIVLEYTDKIFNSRLTIGPMHKDEVKNQLNFESESFSKAGLFLDIDYFKTDNIELANIFPLIKESMILIWEKVDSITKKLKI